MFPIHQSRDVAAGRQTAVTLQRSLSRWANLAAHLRRAVPVVLSALIASCGASGTDTPAEPGDTTPPTVTSVSPKNNASNVGLTTSVSATFSEPISDSTASNASFTLATEQGTAIAGTVTVSGNTATFEPTTSFPGKTRVNATLATSVRDAAGNALASGFSWSFTTGAEPDVTAPTVTGISPLNGALAVALNSAVSVTFSETMTLSTVTPASMIVAASGGAPVAGTVSMIGTTVTFAPTADLSPGTLYSVTVTTDAKDAAGNPLASNFVSAFTTGATPDDTAPTVTATTPAASVTGVSRSAAVSATFSEPMSDASITTASFTLAPTAGSGAVAGTVSVTGSVATFTPSVILAGSTQYTATITTGVQDAAGNPLASTYTWTFTTAAPPDLTPPTIIATTPAAGATGVALASPVTVTFSEPMTNATLTTASVTLVTTAGSVVVPGTVSVSGNTATYTPTANLAGTTQYTATVTTAAKDAAGNSLAANVSWSFTTTAAPDLTPPIVVSTTPASGATGASRTAPVTVTFSEPMTSATITTASFTIAPASGGANVTGTVTASGMGATFTPAAALAGSTQFRASLTTAVKDVAGNALAATYTWTFTTAAPPDLTPPTIIATTPATGATGVAVASPVTVTFSEPMTNSSLNTSTVTLVTTTGGVAVAGTVSLSGNTATFTPGASLAFSTQYTATVTTGARDVAGNALAANVSWSFTTVAPPGLGVHALAFRSLLDLTKPTVATPALVTRATGSSILVCIGRGTVSDHVPPTDNKGNTYTQIGIANTFTRIPASGTACYVAANAVGGTGHIVTAPNGVAVPRDAVTLSVVEIVNAGRIQDFKWNEDLTSPLVSLNVAATGPATLVALWWGDGGAITAHTATPNNQFGVVHSLLDLGLLRQVSVATRNVSAAGSYNVTWTSGEGAQLWIFAVQP